MLKKTTQEEFAKRCKKYGLPSNCAEDDVKRVRKQGALDFLPDREQNADDVLVANKMLAEINDDCDYLIIHLSHQRDARNSRPTTTTPPRNNATSPNPSRPEEKVGRTAQSGGRYHIALRDDLLKDPNIIRMYEQHLQWCVQTQPFTLTARDVWENKYRDYMKSRVDERRFNERQEELRKAREQERENQELERERERLEQRRRDLEKKYSRQFDMARFSPAEISDSYFTRIREEHLYRCSCNEPTDEEAERVWALKYSDYQDDKRRRDTQELKRREAVQRQEQLRLQQVAAETEVRKKEAEAREQKEKQKREQQIASLQADLTRYENELDLINTNTQYVLISDASKTFDELKRGKQFLSVSVDAVVQHKIIAVRCLILEKRCVDSKLTTQKWLTAATTKLSNSYSKTNSSNKSTTSDGAKIGAAIGGVIGLFGGVPGMIFGAALGGAIGAGTGSIVEADDETERASARSFAEIEVCNYKDALQKWEELINKIIALRLELDG